MSLPRTTILVLALAVTAACGDRGEEVTLTRIKNTGSGPDEFTILPTKPLQSPDSYNDLPPPAPGAPNLVDPNPKAEGVAALGGNPAATAGRQPAAADSALVRHAARHGVPEDIRRELALEDRETRRRHGRVNILRLGPTDDYTDAYKDQWLNAQAEERRLRLRGIETPTNPPGEDSR